MAIDPKKAVDQLQRSEEPAGIASERLARLRELLGRLENTEAREIESLGAEEAAIILEASVRAKLPRLAEALSSSADKNIAKAAKRAAYQLRSGGVQVATPAKEGVKPVARPSAASKELPARLGPVDGTGHFGLFLAQFVTRSSGGVEIVQAGIHTERGLKTLRLANMSRSTYRDLDAQLAGFPTLTPERARALLGDAVARTLAARDPLPPDTEAALRHFGARAEPVAEDIPRLESVDDDALHAEPEVAEWLPDMDVLRSLALKLDEIAQSPLYINEAQRTEQVQHQIRASAESYFTAERREHYARRLMRIAEYFENANRRGPAVRAREEASRLIHSPHLVSAFSLRLFSKILRPMPKNEDEAATEGAAGGELPHAPAERRSAGGLILP